MSERNDVTKLARYLAGKKRERLRLTGATTAGGGNSNVTDVVTLPLPFGTEGQVVGLVDVGGDLVADWVDPTGGAGVSLLDVSTMHRYPLWAHRGDIGSVDSYPENTVESHRQAILKGCDGVELDVRLSANGTWWVMHDATVDRTTNGTGSVSALTDATLAALHINAGFGYDAGRHGTALGVPTLAAVLTALQPYDAVYKIELVASGTANATALATFLLANARPSQCLLNVGTLAEAAAVKAVSAAFAVMVGSGLSGAVASADVDWLATNVTNLVDLDVATDFAPKRLGVYVSISDYGADESTWFHDGWDYGAACFQTNHVDAALALRKALLYGSYDDERAIDAVAGALVAGDGITIDVDDPGGTITLATTAGAGGRYRHLVLSDDGAGGWGFVVATIDGQTWPVTALADLE